MFESEITCIAEHVKLNKIAVGTKGKPPKNINGKIEGRRGGDSILKEKKIEYIELMFICFIILTI